MITETLLTVVWIGYAAIFGLLIGSFLNVCIYRLPAKITIVKGHSFCPNCKHPLNTFDLFPVFSYLLLGRKCRYCREPISSRYMKVELLTGVYFAIAAWFLRPGQVSLPNWLTSTPGADFEASLILTLAAGLAFSTLLVWAMIIWDQNAVPNGLFVFAVIPTIIRLAMQPQLILTHVFALLVSLLLAFALMLLKLMPESTNRELLQNGIGLGLIALMSGLITSAAIFVVVLIELLVVKALADQDNPTIARHIGHLRRSVPLQVLIIGSVLQLIFQV